MSKRTRPTTPPPAPRPPAAPATGRPPAGPKTNGSVGCFIEVVAVATVAIISICLGVFS